MNRPAVDLLELCDLATLAEAQAAAGDSIRERHGEGWFINLQNHLVWGSFRPGEDPDADAVVLHAIAIVLGRRAATAKLKS